MKLVKIYIYALAFLWTLLITALVGNVIADAPGGTPSQINFAMFVAVFSWIALIIGLTAALLENSRTMPLINLGADALAIFFTFIAAVVLSAKLGVNSCGNSDYVDKNDTLNGSSKRCHELQASTAFFWFLFATYIATLTVSLLGSRKGGLTMSQIKNENW